MVMTDKIAINIAEALNAIVEQESGNYQQQCDAKDAHLLAQKQKLARLMTALAEVERQVTGRADIKISIQPHGHRADVTVCDRRFSITTDQNVTRFEIDGRGSRDFFTASTQTTRPCVS